MKICLYSPYLSTGVIGGGEKHILEFARIAAKKHTVDIAISGSAAEAIAKQIEDLQQRLTSFLGWSTDLFTFVPTPLGTNASPLSKIWWTRQYDYLYYATDGSLFFSAATTNNLHIQIPFTQRKDSLLERMKLANWNCKNANSNFTKEVVEHAWSTTVPFVHYPMVNVKEFAGSTPKEKIILSVGRFFRHLHSKRQDVLIAAFRQLLLKHPEQFAGWKLILVGPNEDPSYTLELRELAKGLPVEFLHSIDRQALVKLYKRARFCWHAAGFEQDSSKHPEAVEHFGISIVEAMAAGAVPVVVGAGGPVEILKDQLKQLLWQTIPECIAVTAKLAGSHTLESKMRTICINRASDFSETHFESTVWQMLE